MADPRNMSVAIRINGTTTKADIEPRTLLVEFIREYAGLTGTHVGCDTSYCGACTVILDGGAVKSCSVLAVQADGLEITTVEGLEQGGKLHPLQTAFAENHGLQCGFCTPGALMAALALLQSNPQPDEPAIRKGLAGNTCRCTGYLPIIAAVQAAAEKMKEPAS